MNPVGGRAAEAERRLAEIGIEARVLSAGAEHDVALIRSAESCLPELLGDLRCSAVEVCRAAGFRYVTVELY
jgi:hypothetical protein